MLSGLLLAEAARLVFAWDEALRFPHVRAYYYADLFPKGYTFHVRYVLPSYMP